MAEKQTKLVISNDWYLENREKWTNEDTQEQYYDLPLNSILDIRQQYEESTGTKISWLSELLPLNESTRGWVNVKLIFTIENQDSKSTLEWIGSAISNNDPVKGEISPLVTAQNQALRNGLKRIISQANLPKELTIVEQDQIVAANETELDLPDVSLEEVEIKKAKKPASKSKKATPVKEEIEQVVIEENIVEEDEVIEEDIAVKTVNEETDNDELEKAYNLNIREKLSQLNVDTMKELLDMPNGETYIKFYSDKLGQEKYEQLEDICSAARIITEAHNLQGRKAK